MSYHQLFLLDIYQLTRARGLVVINLKAKIQYGKATKIRVQITGELLYQDSSSGHWEINISALPDTDDRHVVTHY